MARSSRSSRPAPSRAAPAQSRGAHTMAAPPASAPHAPPASASTQAQPRQPGLLGQMAATAGSVAIGSTIGHGLSNMLFGGGSTAAPQDAAAPQPVAQQQAMSCDFQAKAFTQCMESGDINTCGWYLEQLKACQKAASPY